MSQCGTSTEDVVCAMFELSGGVRSYVCGAVFKSGLLRTEGYVHEWSVHQPVSHVFDITVYRSFLFSSYVILYYMVQAVLMYPR
jgi:hypothetical protein